MDERTSAIVNMAGCLQHDESTPSQLSSAGLTDICDKEDIAGANSAASLDTNENCGKMVGADTAAITTPFVEHFASMKTELYDVSALSIDKPAVMSVFGNNENGDGNDRAMDADALIGKRTVDLPNEVQNTSGKSACKAVVRKSSCAGSASVDTTRLNGIVELVGIASSNTKRARKEENILVESINLNPVKRVAYGNDDSVVSNFAGQTTDEAVDDSSDDVEMSEPMDEEVMLFNGANCTQEDGIHAYEKFWCDLTVKQQVDVFDIRIKEWLAAIIELVDNESYTVHYVGWNSNYIEKIGKASSYRIMPRATKAAKAWANCQEKILKHRHGVEEKLLAHLPVDDKLKQAYTRGRELAPAFVQAGLTRSGRAITQRTENGASKQNVRSKKQKNINAVKSKLPEEDLCGICGEIEDDDLTDSIMCDGGCLESYHFSCLGIGSAPEGVEWLCEQCRTNEQLCFACGRNGTINEKGGVFRCSAVCCGKFFHQECVDSHKMSRRIGVKAKPGSSATKNLKFDAPFRCPRHVCFVCEGEKKTSDLMCCLKCPEAYHPQCVPPSARYNTVGLLCWKHPDDNLPKIPPFYLSNRAIETVTVDSSLHLPWLFLPKHEPDASKPSDYHHFRLLSGIIEEVRLQPPTYRKLGRSIYTFKQPRISLEDAPMCVCKERCEDDCINRLSFTECFGSASTAMMKFNKQNRESNCMLGESCGNRAIHQKMYPRFQKFHTAEKGWGLRVLEQVKKGQLVIEYVGEVINEKEKEYRLLDHAKNNPEDKNMYIMELGKGEYIDARFKGSVSRFINHSCDPNCHLLKWRVKGVNRIAITALKDIEPGTELSYDYQFHTKQAMEWKCHCKAKNCRGTMAPEKINQADKLPVKRLSKKEQLKQRKRALMQEKLHHNKEVKSTARRLSLTVQISIGDRTTIDKMAIRTGPAARELQWARHYHLFSVRDAKHGFNFKLRKELRDLRIRNHDNTSSAQLCILETASSQLGSLDCQSEDKSKLQRRNNESLYDTSRQS